MWREKPWGWQRCLVLNSAYEVWQGIAKSGTETSMHCHPHHHQQLVVVSGLVTVVFAGVFREKLKDVPPGDACNVPDNRYHQLRFAYDSKFIEIYTKQGNHPSSVENSIIRFQGKVS